VKIAIYIEHGSGNGVGGAELEMAHLGSAWSVHHEVHLVHHRASLTHERFAAFSEDDLSRVRLRFVEREAEPCPARGDWHRLHAAREWHRSISEGYDIFVNCTHWLPCFCHAPVGLLRVLFPIYIRPDADPSGLALWRRVRRSAYYGFEWAARLRTYRHRTTNSRYSAHWARQRWGVSCRVVYPPVDVDIPSSPKEPLILSIGRFTTRVHTKNQLELVAAFQRWSRQDFPGWTYAAVGGLNDRPDDDAYFQQVAATALGGPVSVQANLPRAAVRALLTRARIFWHGAGLDADLESHPERAEHFGIATVEAMAAGCVPVVFDAGGQPEIVEHGVSGFLWKHRDELRSYTRLLAADEALWARMSAAAQAAAQKFSRQRFVREMSELAGLPVPECPEVAPAVSTGAGVTVAAAPLPGGRLSTERLRLG
jgi:glycosyltransferase involved in cell wall biosynthesis